MSSLSFYLHKNGIFLSVFHLLKAYLTLLSINSESQHFSIYFFSIWDEKELEKKYWKCHLALLGKEEIQLQERALVKTPEALKGLPTPHKGDVELSRSALRYWRLRHGKELLFSCCTQGTFEFLYSLLLKKIIAQIENSEVHAKPWDL